MPTILGANSVRDAYQISNSLRFNDGDSPQLSDAITSTSASWTVSTWTKRGNDLTSNNYIISWGTSGTDGTGIGFAGTGKFFYYSEDDPNISIQTTGVYRDPSAWYHCVVKCASGTITLFINGESVATGSGGNPLDSSTVKIGSWVGDNLFHDGYLSDLYFIDGTGYDASYFGKTNSNGVWIPKKASDVTFGTHGFKMEFKQTGTSTNASGIGADTSGNDNHFAVSNLAAIDVTTDTPTNNFATINPIANYFNPAGLSEGNTRVDFANDTSTSYVISTIGVDAGKWYCEVKGVDIPSYGEIGIASRPRQNSGNNDKLTVNQYNYGYTANNGNVKSNNTAGSSYGDSYADGDMIGIAMDLDNNKLYFSKNGTFQNSGDPTTGSTGTGSIGIVAASNTHDGVYYFAGGSNKNNDTTRMDFNFGNPAFAISSSNADANGHGNFEYAVPSGYFALCTKNLAENG